MNTVSVAILDKQMMKRNLKRQAWKAALLLGLLAANLVGGTMASQAAPLAQEDDPTQKALALLETLTPEERVGQLFLVTFRGFTAAQESQIYDLIANYHIGGVMLRRDMDNFVAAPDTVAGAANLIADLQGAEAVSSETRRADVISGDTYTPSYIPIFIALSEEGDGYPTDQILSGLSPLPSAMTIGATWNPDLARQAGELLGSELSALGVNLLLGPSLDVLESPRPRSPGDLAARSFGGDPFWVGKLGQAFIEGVHVGSANQVAVVAKHLPGYGGSDRPTDEELPTVRKSLNQLTQIELPPFFAVTGEASSLEATADAMLLAHIRYQGFQGNIRATTRPISFDPQAFAQLMALPQFATWRANGGLIISDSLGTRAIRRNYDPAEQMFNSPLVARDAFLAGNDVLYLGNFVANNDPDAYASIVRTVEFFAHKYREDQAFSERVDQAVTRILALKFKIYPDFSPSEVLPDADAVQTIGQNESLIFEIGRQAATLLSPSAEELPNLLPEPPGQFEQIVFFTDVATVQQCSQCDVVPSIDPSALSEAVLGLYGPNAGNQITAANLVSFSFIELLRTLDDSWPGGEDPVAGNMQRAEWVVFALGRDDGSPESAALRRLLSERPDMIQNKRVIVFALNAPYFLDATDITKITAYYGLYSKQQGIAEVAARLLYQEISMPGNSPVSIEGIGYELIEATSPDETQVIPIGVQRILPASIETPGPTSEATAEPTPIPTYQAGDLLSLQAGPIIDHNGHTVPDSTPVTFGITIVSEGTTLTRQVNATTRNGMALASYSIEEEGSLQILASSGEPPASSEALRFDVIGINPEGLALQATQTAQAQSLATAAAAPETTPTPFAATEQPEEPKRANLVDWFLITMVSVVAGAFAYQVGLNMRKVRWAVRWGLTTFIGGLLVGSYLALDLPGSHEVFSFSGEWGVVISVLTGAGLGWLVGWLWLESTKAKTEKSR
ncbi:MAG: glycoside hydrolase family 3 N-terminal domain-containing protein [Anaerolineales bacterium]